MRPGWAVLRWSLAFLVIAIPAELLGAGGTVPGASDFSHACFHFSLGIFIVSLVWGLVTGRAGARLF